MISILNKAVLSKMDALLCFAFLPLVLLLAQKATADVERTNTFGTEVHVGGVIGAIVDNSSRFGKEQKVAMEMAIEDVFNRTNQAYDLHMKYSHRRKPYQAALAGM